MGVLFFKEQFDLGSFFDTCKPDLDDGGCRIEGEGGLACVGGYLGRKRNVGGAL